MFRQTPLTKSDLARSIVARETATKVRYFDPETARMSSWMPKPAQAPDRALGSLSITFETDTSWAEGALMEVMEAVYAMMPVGELRTLASKSGVKNASRMRKADVIAALMAQPLTLTA
jgi:hypothetical protein